MTVEIFRRCHSCLRKMTYPRVMQADIRGIQPTSCDEEAKSLLDELGYLSCAMADGKATATAIDRETTENRLALLQLASHLDRMFRLPSAQAPGAFFLGAEVTPELFGLASPDGSPVSASGRGLSLQAAFESCVGEAAEYLSFLEWGDEPKFTATLSDVVTETSRHIGRPTADDCLAWLLMTLGVSKRDLLDHSIEWISFRRFDSGDELPVPLDLCLRRAPSLTALQFKKAESSGCPAGPSLEAAQYAGLMELVERDAVALWWYGGLPAGALQLDAEAVRSLTAFMADLRQAATRPSWFLDITNDTHLPTVAALSSETNGAAVVCGFAADVDPLVAARKAALEMCQMELAGQVIDLKIKESGVEGLHASDLRTLERTTRMRVDSFPQLSPRRAPMPRASGGASTTKSALAEALMILNRRGFAPFWFDLTRPEIGTPVVRVIVPHLQSIDVSRESDRLKIVSLKHNQSGMDYSCFPPII